MEYSYRFARTVVPYGWEDAEWWELCRRRKARCRRLTQQTSEESTDSIGTSECSDDAQRAVVRERYRAPDQGIDEV